MSSTHALRSRRADKLFVAPDGSPLTIYGHDGLPNSLAKLLEEHGAAVCTRPEDAGIILVGATLNLGTWNTAFCTYAAGSKYILSLGWVHRCLDEGRALLEGDNFGGCRLEVTQSTPATIVPPVAAPTVQIPGQSASLPDNLLAQLQTLVTQLQHFAPAHPMSTASCPPERSRSPTSFPATHGLSMDGCGSQTVDDNLDGATPLSTRSLSTSGRTSAPATEANDGVTDPSTSVKLTAKKPAFTFPTASSDTQYAMKSSVNPPKSTRRPEPGASGGTAKQKGDVKSLFVADDGSPMRIFVHFELPGRVQIIASVKEHGGRIEKDVEKACYCVLAPRSQTFAEYRAMAVTVNCPVVGDKFIRDSIAFKELQDPAQYQPEVRPEWADQRYKTSRGSFLTSGRRRKSIPTSRDGVGQVRKGTGGRASREKPATRIHTKERGRGSRCSLPPEPPSTPTYLNIAGSKRCLFTEDEKDYARALISYLAETNSSLTKQAAAVALHEKIPHHSMRSWLYQVNKYRDEFESIIATASTSRAQTRRSGHPEREQLAEAYDSEAHREKSITESSDQMEVEQLVDSQEPQPNSEPICEDADESDDFTTVIEFLLQHDLDNTTDETLWKSLDEQATCKSANSWDDFVDLHDEAILAEVTRRSGSQ